MKVLVTTGLYPPEIGGPATYSRLLEAGLPEHGIDVDVLPFSRVRGYWYIFRYFAFFILIVRRGWRSDVLYAQDTMSVGMPTWAANFILRKKFLVRVPGDHSWEQGVQRFGVTELLDTFPLWNSEWPLVLKIMRFIQLRVVRSAQLLIVPSAYMRDIVTRWGVSAQKVKVIYNGVHVGDVGTRKTIRGMLHFDGTLIISVGRLVPWKGFDALIRTFAKMFKKRKDLRLLIVGSGPDAQRLEKLVGELKLSEHVLFAGSVERDVLLRYIRAADIFVLNTAYEGLSHTILETMAIGVPVVTTRVGGNPEVITDGIDGYLVKPNDQSALQSRITTLLEKPYQYTKVVTAGKARVARFTDESVVLESVKLLRSL